MYRIGSHLVVHDPYQLEVTLWKCWEKLLFEIHFEEGIHVNNLQRFRFELPSIEFNLLRTP